MHACCSEPSVASSLWLVFAGGLLGSAHCMGMCGPLAALAESVQPGRWTPWRSLPLHAGRLATYAALGALAGLAGWAVERGGAAVGVQNVAAFLGGGAMILFALVLLDWLPWRAGRSIGDRAAQRIAAALSSRRPLGGLLMGICWGLLPCGLVWAFLPRAAVAGSLLGGATVMLSFGVGTVPALLVLGGLAGFVSARHRALLSRLGAVAVLLMGVLLILRGAAAAGWIGHLHVARGVPLF